MRERFGLTELRLGLAPAQEVLERHRIGERVARRGRGRAAIAAASSVAARSIRSTRLPSVATAP